jgi:hypothetical protein
MSDSLTTLTTKLQALLLDNGTLFTSGSCTAAIRQALSDVNLRLPINAGTLITIVSGQYEYELTDAIAGATPIGITNVLLSDPAGKEYDVSLDFDQYIEDERWFLRLHAPLSSGQMIVRFTQSHTVNGLDSATESTLPARYDPVLLDGAAAYACTMAQAGKIEANNLDPTVSANYAKAADHFRNAFDFGMQALSAIRPAQRSVMDTRAWNDEWHNF